MAFDDFGPGMQRVRLESTNATEDDPTHVRLGKAPSARLVCKRALEPALDTLVVACGYTAVFARAYFGVGADASAAAALEVDELDAPGVAPILLFQSRDGKSAIVACPVRAGPASEEFGSCVAEALFEAVAPST